ncbi:hypothetical protein WJX84_003941 [Apatococcus fuscideae]|uniref:PI31 proteasome regulator N-terminal domain-containing protein n=1 Tax=Apatococcus fuscideae TaxID=2026836 RepID=A0AAW1TB76_9CHLO
MASATVLQAIIRASRPKFRNAHDRLAFAVHSFLLADGSRLVAVGKDAEEATTGSLQSSEEIAVDGWNEMSDAYAFAYTDSQGRHPRMVKCVVLGEQLLVHLLHVDSNAEPQLLELDVTKFSNSSPDLIKGYSDLDGLVQKLQQNLQQAATPSTGSGQTASQGVRSSTGPSLRQDLGTSSLRDERETDPANPLLIGNPVRGGRMPMGAEDLMSPGFPTPGMGPGMPGFPGFPGSRSGGMHMGPDDPLFAGRRGMGMGPGSTTLPPAGRFDPIAPPGLPGSHPDDFTPGGHGMHPDVMQPGPGRGTDWDSMFG